MIEHLLNGVIVGIMGGLFINLIRFYRLYQEDYEARVRAIGNVYRESVQAMQETPKPSVREDKPRVGQGETRPQ